MDVANRCDDLTLNMENLEYVSSAGLRSLRMAVITMRNKGRTIVASHVSDTIRDVFKITGFLAMIKIV